MGANGARSLAHCHSCRNHVTPGVSRSDSGAGLRAGRGSSGSLVFPHLFPRFLHERKKSCVKLLIEVWTCVPSGALIGQPTAQRADEGQWGVYDFLLVFVHTVSEAVKLINRLRLFDASVSADVSLHCRWAEAAVCVKTKPKTKQKTLRGLIYCQRSFDCDHGGVKVHSKVQLFIKCLDFSCCSLILKLFKFICSSSCFCLNKKV